MFDTIATSATQIADVRKVFTFAAEAKLPSAQFLSIVEKSSLQVVPAYGAVIPEHEIEEIAERLTALSEAALQIAQNLKLGKAAIKVNRRSKVMHSAKLKHVAIFVALEMERRILIDRWGLKGKGVEQIWRGDLRSTSVSVFSQDEMGRVPAAVATMQFLHSETPDLLLIAGIAGGFEREGASLGNIPVPTSIVDLASRKTKAYRDERSIREFRWREFQTDERLEHYLKAALRENSEK